MFNFHINQVELDIQMTDLEKKKLIIACENLRNILFCNRRWASQTYQRMQATSTQSWISLTRAESSSRLLLPLVVSTISSGATFKTPATPVKSALIKPYLTFTNGHTCPHFSQTTIRLYSQLKYPTLCWAFGYSLHKDFQLLWFRLPHIVLCWLSFQVLIAAQVHLGVGGVWLSDLQPLLRAALL